MTKTPPINPIEGLSWTDMVDYHVERTYLHDLPLLDASAPIRWQPLDPIDPTHDWGFVRLNQIPIGGNLAKDSDLFDFQSVLAALASLSSLKGEGNFRLALILSGNEGRFALHFGISRERHQRDDGEVQQSLQQVAAIVGSHLPGIKTDTLEERQRRELLEEMSSLERASAISGIPSLRHGSERYLVQTIDRFASQLREQRFALVILADPLDDHSIVTAQRKLRQLISELHPLVKVQSGTSQSQSEVEQLYRSLQEVGKDKSKILPTLGLAAIKIISSIALATKNPFALMSVPQTLDSAFNDLFRRNITHQVGTSLGTEQLNREVQEIESRLEMHHQRLQKGRNLGLWETGVYLLSDSDRTDQLGTSLLRSIAAGQDTHLEPIRVHHFSRLRRPQTPAGAIQTLQYPALRPETLKMDGEHPLGGHYRRITTILNTEELSLWMGLPRRELPGISARQRYPDFAVDAAEPSPTDLNLGHLMDFGVALQRHPLSVPLKDLTSHMFITGTTGSGKSNTTRQVLLELTRQNIPFLVIEPAKMEYADHFLRLKQQGQDVEVAIPGMDERLGQALAQLRLNPFEPVPGFPVEAHLDRLKTTMAASFSMQDVLPLLLEAALVEAYRKVGWLRPTASGLDPEKYPSVEHLRGAVQVVLERNRYGQEIQANLTAALNNRISALTMGRKNQLFGAAFSMFGTGTPADASGLAAWDTRMGRLFTRPAIINLSMLGDDADKSLVMGLLLNLLHEYRFVRGSARALQHVTVLEEAHRILRKPEPGMHSSKSHASEMFADLLAEVRDYGEGLIIVDQIPGKLIPDVLKNTNLKIVHRILARDDQEALAGSMGMTETQRTILTQLQKGEAVVQNANRVSLARIHSPRDLLQ